MNTIEVNYQNYDHMGNKAWKGQNKSALTAQSSKFPEGTYTTQAGR